MILLVDNYDSFTYNLLDYVQSLGAECKVLRNDLPFEEYLKEDWQGIILSPGPGKPSESGKLMQLIDYFHYKKPILGICLGHQALGIYFGAKLEKAPEPVHGKESEIFVKKDVIYNGIPEKIKVVRYHSLLLSALPDSLNANSFTTKDNLLMGFKHANLPIWGIQFHPEAYLTEYGKRMIQNWLEYITIKNIVC